MLVLPPNDTPDIDPPDLRRPEVVAEGFERYFHFNRPVRVRSVRPGLPNSIPVTVAVAFVRHMGVSHPPYRIRSKQESVTPVVECVQDDRETVVLGDVEAVSLQLVGDRPVRAAVGALGSHIDTLGVKQDPYFRVFGCRFAFPRFLLNKTADRRDGPVDLFIKAAIDAHWLGNPRRPHRRTPVGRSGDHRRRSRQLWAVNGEIRRRSRSLGKERLDRTAKACSRNQKQREHL